VVVEFFDEFPQYLPVLGRQKVHGFGYTQGRIFQGCFGESGKESHPELRFRIRDSLQERGIPGGQVVQEARDLPAKGFRIQ
jgi:hypothetical protein